MNGKGKGEDDGFEIRDLDGIGWLGLLEKVFGVWEWKADWMC